MDLISLLTAISPSEWLAVGLVLFAGAQIVVQVRQEQQRRRERIEDREESADRAFHYVWAEHFQLEGLADRLRNADLIELAVLGVLRPADVLPHDWSGLTTSLASLGREAGVLGGFAVALSQDVEHAVALFVGSVRHFEREAPEGMSGSEKVQWLRENYGEALEPWEESVRELVQQLSSLLFDAACQSPRATVERDLDFNDQMTSRFGRDAVKALLERSSGTAKEHSEGNPD